MHASYNFWAMGGWVKAWHKTTKMRRRFSNISLAELEMQLRERWGRRRRQRQRKATDSDAEEQGDKNGSVRGSVSGSVTGVAAGGDNSARPSRGASPERNGGLAALVVQVRGQTYGVVTVARCCARVLRACERRQGRSLAVLELHTQPCSHPVLPLLFL